MTVQADNVRLRELVSRHEGKRLDMYKDSEGIWTIGIGHNLEANGISEEVCNLIFQEDIAVAITECEKLSWFRRLDDVRQVVVVDMVFNMGLPRFNGFKKTIEFLKNELWISAAKEMLDSRWADQVGPRATRLSNMIRTGEWP